MKIGLIKKIPVVGNLARWVHRQVLLLTQERALFAGSVQYWEGRYASGGNSGVGSYSKFALFKAEVVNTLVEKESIQSVIDFGCGDGSQLSLLKFPRYLGLDVSPSIVSKCRVMFASDPTKSFVHMSKYNGEKAELGLSLDVIYHLVEDTAFEDYMRRLFTAATKFVLIYSSNSNKNSRFQASHVKHRNFTTWIRQNAQEWKLVEHIPNRYPHRGDESQGSFADFFIFERGGVI